MALRQELLVAHDAVRARPGALREVLDHALDVEQRRQLADALLGDAQLLLERDGV
jgi:hypothetical protein